MNELLIRYFVFCLAAATLLALLEIQIEGRYGWAEKLPTWRFRIKLVDLLPGLQGEFTGYHLYFFISVLALLHIPFVFMRWDIHTELILISAYVLLTNVEDFLWFLLNPHFGIERFNKKYIKWHKDWLGPFPLRYFYSALLWTVLFLVGFRIIG
jgi:hypothetical protein